MHALKAKDKENALNEVRILGFIFTYRYFIISISE